MSVYQNAKNLLSVLMLAGADKTVLSTFGGYEEAASAQADLNTLGAIMDSNVVTKHFSNRKPQQQLSIEDILGIKEPEPKPEPKSREQTLMEWWNSLTPDEQKFFQDLNK